MKPLHWRVPALAVRVPVPGIYPIRYALARLPVSDQYGYAICDNLNCDRIKCPHAAFIQVFRFRFSEIVPLFSVPRR